MCCTCSLSCAVGCSSHSNLGSDFALVFKISSDFLCDFAIVYTRDCCEVTHYIEMGEEDNGSKKEDEEKLSYRFKESKLKNSDLFLKIQLYIFLKTNAKKNKNVLDFVD
ncbi:hypothetical protein ACSBR1_035942 [Camellia fascicularis]